MQARAELNDQGAAPTTRAFHFHPARAGAEAKPGRERTTDEKALADSGPSQ